MRILSVTILGMALSLGACQQRQSVEPEPEPAPSQAIAAEFQAVADALLNSDNPYLGRQQLEAHRTSLEQERSPSPLRVNLGLQLCWTQLRLGDIDAAAQTIEGAFADVAAIGGLPSGSMLKLRGLVYLREAEYRNCVERHTAQCCLFPLSGGGVHALKQPAALARDSFLEMLKLQPNDIEARWLLNITGMAIGGYPENTPEEFRFPKDALQGAPCDRSFVDVAAAKGVATFNLSGGTAVEDFDGDGLLDIVTSTYDPNGSLTFYRQRADGSFEDRTEIADLRSQLGGLNVLSADYDNDGDSDLLVLRGAWLKDQGQIRNSLLRNDGDKFTDVTMSAGLASPARPTQAAAWADFDNDGLLDLYIGNESRLGSPGEGGDYPSQLFRSNGDGTFSDIAEQAGVTNDRYCKGVAVGDIDNDGLLDLYVSNQGPNRLYRNLGAMKFQDIAPDGGLTEPSKGSFACWFFDYDNDGHLDLFVAAFESSNADVAAAHLGLPHQGTPPSLYRNRGDGTFEDVAGTVGLAGAWMPMGANFGDIDNDGYLDIYLTTGRPDFAALMPNVMLRNTGANKFEDVTVATGLGHLQKGHGVAFADIDRDGDQDIYHQLGGFYPGDAFHNALFENRPSASIENEPPNRFLVLKLIGTTCNRQAIGARVRVVIETPNGLREIHRAAGFVSSFGGSPSRLEIGLSRATAIRKVEIVWPGTNDITVTTPSLDSCVTVTQGEK
ncbi:MAG: CRTAC1 family protein [Verrucomicrobia bacterium]|nr:CRTAC1 family protein [Verrucomicrobiota bacterium]